MLKIMKLIIILMLLNVPVAEAVQVAAQLYVNGVKNGTAIAGEKTPVKINVFDASGEKHFHHFHPMHEKEMHMLVIKDDLSSFAHVHPTRPNEHATDFNINLNEVSPDPDNKDTQNTITYGGNYFVFAETMPMGAAMVMLPMNMSVIGEQKDKQKLVLDEFTESGFIEKIVVQADKKYFIRLQPRPFVHCDKLNLNLNIELYRMDSHNNKMPVTDLQTWLGAFGHAVVISEWGEKAEDKQIIHMHSVWPLPDDATGPRGPELELSTDTHLPLKEGLHKMWLQVKLDDSVQTVPFVFNISKALALTSKSALCFQ